ncbi:MAG: hypothetical protein P4L56_08515 [Candidatus Sulfopaludibacter sp.]|nr:hypothetical protein [Candidatus Sulfopaludibacter sp.]
MKVLIEKTNFHGWPNSYGISNGTVEAVITGDVGPRVIRYGFVGGQNLFKEFAGQLGQSGEPDWQPRGGHRIWMAPEDPVKSYAPDNHPVHIAIAEGVLEATAPVEPLTGLEKQIVLKMAPQGTEVEIIHKIRNVTASDCEIAPWALTMMAQGGAGIHGFPPRGTHPEMLAPTNPLVMWAFTNLADPRWRLLQKYLVLLQDPHNSVPQKLGSFHSDTWGAYLLNGELFVKRVTAEGSPARYPDCGCSFETFTNAGFLELETLGPLTRLRQGETVSHTERWSLHRGVTVSEWTDAELDRVLLPLVGAY